jgi:molecular chaperone DnaJ
MATVRDLYDILGIGHEASAEEIRKAYRKLARELHPDVSDDPAAEERFKEVTGAYEILSNPDRRARYDRFGAVGPGGEPFTDLQDIFDMFFGGSFDPFGGTRRRRGRRSPIRRGEDLAVTVRLSFEEAAFGVRREIEVERLAVCDRCLGNGAEPGTAPMACRTCGGTGEVQDVRRSVFGTLMTSSPCRTCGGTGQEIPDKCERCFGRGRIQEPAKVTVDIPAGVGDGMELRVGGSGHAGVAGGPAGELYVALQVDPSSAFERRGQDLFTVLDISTTQAALGATVTVSTLDGDETVKVDAGTESGTVARLRGKGIPNLNRRGRGDLYVTLHVVTPTELSRDERQLYERLAELRGEDPRRPADGSLRRPEY